MGRLTTDMTRLVEDIHAARGERQRLIRAISQAAVDMRRSMARMQAGFRTAHAEMARRQQRGLLEIVSALKGRVESLRNEIRTDLAGGRAAWHGTVAASPAREHSKRGTKATSN